MTAALFEPVALGDIALANRVVMAPLTRSRARPPDDVPALPLAATYYRQRASAGLIIAEAMAVSAHATAYAFTPGMYREVHVAAWREITDAVHAAGGRIFAQLFHAGRISHTALLPDGRAPVAPSAVRANARSFVATGAVACSPPCALDRAGIADVVAQFATAAACARAAGFDGVELHGAYGYLLDQFTRDGANHRRDDYGGSPAGRARLPLEVTRAVVEIWGPGRVGYRISPADPFNDIADTDPRATFGHLAVALGRLRLAYLHVVEPCAADGGRDEALADALRAAFAGPYLAAGGYTADTAAARITTGRAAAVAFGALFIANPDLPARFRLGAPLNAPDPSTYYGGDARGYTDYPSLPPRPRTSTP